jgi:hypothetical protein
MSDETQPAGIKYIDIAEFVAFGYLQEVNRQFFHPLGLALAVSVEEDGSMSLGGVWDDRDDEQGVCFGDGVIDPEKANRVALESNYRAVVRERDLGFTVQPLS